MMNCNYSYLYAYCIYKFLNNVFNNKLLFFIFKGSRTINRLRDEYDRRGEREKEIEKEERVCVSMFVCINVAIGKKDVWRDKAKRE